MDRSVQCVWNVGGRVRVGWGASEGWLIALLTHVRSSAVRWFSTPGSLSLSCTSAWEWKNL